MERWIGGDPRGSRESGAHGERERVRRGDLLRLGLLGLTVTWFRVHRVQQTVVEISLAIRGSILRGVDHGGGAEHGG